MNMSALLSARTAFGRSSRVLSVRTVSNGSYLHNPGTEQLTYTTLGDALDYTAHKCPGRIAVQSVHENLTLTYEQLITHANALGGYLRKNGFEKGDRLGIWSHNSTAWIVALVAAARAGLISVALNPFYEKPELSFCIKKTGLRGILIGDKLPNTDYYSVLRQLAPELQSATPGSLQSAEFPTLNTVISTGKEKLPGTVLYDTIVKQTRNDSGTYGAEINPEDGCIIYFTSGTTGDPKAALGSHFGLANTTYFTGKRLRFQDSHHNVCVQVPLFHALGSVITLLTCFRHGSTLVLAAPTYNVSSNLSALLNQKCTLLTGTPTMFVDLVHQIKSKGAYPSSLKVALTSGAPCSPELIRQIQYYLKADSVNCLYGMTETTGTFQSVPGDSIEQVSETVGYIMDHVEAKVVDDNGRLVPFGTPGELLIRGYCNMIGYFNDPGNTRLTLKHGGWLRTGDRMILRKDGYGRIVGRLKDIIVRGGENIAPKEIEDLLNTHPDVVESQVIGVSDKRLGEEVCAVMRIREGASVGLQDLTAHCTGRIAKFKIPKVFKIIEEFPKTASGKIQKFKLKDMVEAGKL